MEFITDKVPEEVLVQLPAYYFKLKVIEAKKSNIPRITLKKNNTSQYKVNKFHKLI